MLFGFTRLEVYDVPMRVVGANVPYECSFI